MNGYPHGLETPTYGEALERIAELEEALRSMIEDIEHPDHEKGDWSWQVVVKRARKVLGHE